MTAYTLAINGAARKVDVDPAMPLLWVLRDELDLKGTKFGCGVAQCGYCQAGQIMAATALLSAKPKPTDADIDGAMDGNMCRCATYTRIRAAIKEAAGLPTADARPIGGE